VLNITGLQDRVFYEAEVVERLYATLADARREDWADCGHLIPIEHPQRLADSLARFGTEIEAKP
jgi:pimeloyl-ACP methyl ester carboxylesterase